MKKQIKSVFNFIAIACFLLSLASCGGRGRAVSQLDDMARQVKKAVQQVEAPQTKPTKRGGDKSKYFTSDDDERDEVPTYQPTPNYQQPASNQYYYPQQQVTQEQVDDMWRELDQLMNSTQQLTGYPTNWQPTQQVTQEQMDAMWQELYRLQNGTQQIMNNNYQFQSW